MASLFSGSPGTMAFFLRADSRSSRRNLPLRAFLSGPWQVKQASDRIGRMSGLNWRGCVEVAGVAGLAVGLALSARNVSVSAVAGRSRTGRGARGDLYHPYRKTLRQ